MGIGIRIGGLFNLKAKKWVQGRANQWQHLEQYTNTNQGQKKAWFHVSSLGELEQAIPLIEKLKARNYTTLVSYFSPSGLENASNISAIDFHFYLPLDSKKNARKYIDKINPEIVFWIKNEYWFRFIKEINARKIPLLYISMRFSKEHFLFKNWSAPFRSILTNCHHLFVQDENSKQLLNKHGLDNVTFAGDTRIDRVLSRKAKIKEIDTLRTFKGTQPLIILASVHASDYPIIKAVLQLDHPFKIAIFPHEIDKNSIPSLTSQLDGKYVLFDDWKSGAHGDANVLVVDKMGLLFDCYSYADLVYIGGGFGKGIHNILEPTVFGIPTMIGPRYQKFKEAVEMSQEHLIHVLNDESQIKVFVDDLMEKDGFNDLKLRLQKYFESNGNASNKIISYCIQNQLLINEA